MIHFTRTFEDSYLIPIAQCDTLSYISVKKTDTQRDCTYWNPR